MGMEPMGNYGETKVNVFRCENCGAALEIPSNPKAKVICSSCNTECIITNLVKNQEILSKEDIAGGISIKLSAEKLHIALAEVMTDEATVPLDVLEKGKIIKEEHIMLPGYFFSCNATAPFSYQIGKEKERWNSSKQQMEKYTEWTDAFGLASASAVLSAPGQKDYSGVFATLFSNRKINEIVDIEDLIYPNDSEILNYDYPQAASFDKYVKPQIEKMLEENARKSMSGRSGRDWRGISITGSSINKDEIIRVVLGIYRFVCEYNNEQYTVYVSGDGLGKCHSTQNYPCDRNRREKYSELNNNYYKIKSWHWLLLIPIIGFIIAAIAAGAAFSIGAVASLVALIVLAVNCKKKRKMAKQIIQEFENQVIQARAKFLRSGKKINGFNTKR